MACRSAKWKTTAAMEVVKPSPWARRITADTRTQVSGPALQATRADANRCRPQRHHSRGILHNCASGITPWGTYLTAERKLHQLLQRWRPLAHTRSAGAKKGATGGGYRWHEHDARFDATKNPTNRKWIRLDRSNRPLQPQLHAHQAQRTGPRGTEGATTAVTPDGRAVVYMGEDSRFEYIYKLRAATPSSRVALRNPTSLYHGTLYVAQFAEDGTGQWLPLTHGQVPPLRPTASPTRANWSSRPARPATCWAPPDGPPQWISVSRRWRDRHLHNSSTIRAVPTPPHTSR